MTVEELISKNMSLTDIRITVRVDGSQLLDELNIGLDFGVEPPYPLMVPIDRKHINSMSREYKKKAKYIRKSINTWDDGKDYWQLKVNRIPKAWLELEVYSWNFGHVYRSHHPRSSHHPLDSYEGINITVLPKGEESPIILDHKPKQESNLEGQISLFGKEDDA